MTIDFTSIVRTQKEIQEELLLKYTIFQGTSAFRCVDDGTKRLLGKIDDPNPELTKTAIALIILCRNKQSDLSHEVILGVKSTNLDEAEFAATHRGKTTWTKDHPFTDTDDMLHSAIHRLCEGQFDGEGGHTGWDNAKFWAGGGPKMLYDGKRSHEEHPVRRALAKAALECTPNCVGAGVVCGKIPQQHQIITGACNTRQCLVESGCWDPFCFVDLIKQSSSEYLSELSWLQELELQLILRHELLKSQDLDHTLPLIVRK